jgi:hypothetical protein
MGNKGSTIGAAYSNSLFPPKQPNHGMDEQEYLEIQAAKDIYESLEGKNEQSDRSNGAGQEDI